MVERSEKQKMIAGEGYFAHDPELTTDRRAARLLFERYNQSSISEPELRKDLLQKVLGRCPDECTIEPTFKFDYGYNIYLGDNFYSNFDLIILDVCEVRIGKDCLIGPRVSILTATHPLDAAERATGIEAGAPITIGDRVWIGGSATINPGVTIGDDVIIASGAVVTNDVPDGATVGGIPAKSLRD